MMKRPILTLLLLTLAAGVAHGDNFPTWRIDDALVPLDGTYRVHCMRLDVISPRTCALEVRTQFETIAPLGDEFAALVEFWVEGVTSIGACSVAPDLAGETCMAVNQVRFEASGDYRVCLGLSAFPTRDLGGEWDDFGHGDRNTDPQSIISDIQHSSEMTQDCAPLYQVVD